LTGFERQIKRRRRRPLLNDRLKLMTNKECTIDDALEICGGWLERENPPTNPRTLKGAALVLADEVLRLRRGEFICKKCGLRKDSDQETKHEF